MEISPRKVVYLAIQAGIVITIRREEDGYSGPCIFCWHERSDLWLHALPAHAIAEGRHVPPSFSVIRPTERARFHQLLPGESFRLNVGHFEPFQDQFVPGEKYELFWPGAEYILWDWGFLHELVDHEIGGESHSRAVIPVRGSISFTTIDEEQVIWSAPGPDISPDRIDLSDGITDEDGKPVLTGAKPINFHNIETDVFRLDRRCHDYDPNNFESELFSEWEPD
ncbi:uncharacterized protein N7503_002150 [Penicillium pulvis]|uniref:uncharacterized protein n=1 Tax=Penicillium pulvis TaxID=1562058 RepID=UPI00254843B7|nr:uncharacterized protein N7503_002150 [Penicillium pulvis]KAJ5809932.1 hypothetical protein N7503_002150 [Penicillium pulvis]